MNAMSVDISGELRDIARQLKIANKHLSDISKNLKDARMLVATTDPNKTIQTIEPINIDPRFVDPSC